MYQEKIRKQGETPGREDMCEFEGICIFENCKDCNKENPEECIYSLVMLEEMD